MRNDDLLHLLAAHIALKSATFSVLMNIVIFKIILWWSSNDFMISQTSYIFIPCYNFMPIYLYSYTIIYASVCFYTNILFFIFILSKTDLLTFLKQYFWQLRTFVCCTPFLHVHYLYVYRQIFIILWIVFIKGVIINICKHYYILSFVSFEYLKEIYYTYYFRCHCATFTDSISTKC